MQALDSVFNAPEPVFETSTVGPGHALAGLRFERQGSTARDVSRGYKEMCAKLSNKIWDEPNGRQIRFDIAGKPGIAIVLPTR